MQIAKRVWDFSTSQDLLHDGDRLVLAVSGGPDSLCLLDVLHSLSGRHGLTLFVAHLNHGLRPEAQADADFVRAEAERRGLAFFCERVDVSAAAKDRRQSIETAARALRYDFLSRVAQQTGAGRVTTAHTADDQAETVLMHLLRGSGLRGLRGMLPKRPLAEARATAAESAPYLIRPLLTLSRAEVLAYCRQHNLAPRMDSSNTDTRYFRNRVRHDLLPLLEQYNRNVRAVLARTAAVAAGDYEVLQETLERLWRETVVAEPGEAGRVRFARARWLALSTAQQRALLQAAAEELAGPNAEIAFAPIEAAARFSRSAAPGRSCLLAAGLVLHVSVAHISLSATLPDLAAGDRPRLSAGTLAPGWRLQEERVSAAAWRVEQKRAELVSAAAWNDDALQTDSRWTVFVDADRLAGPLALRARRPGDRFQPLGLGGHRVKLSDFFVNAKIPARQRAEWPLLVCGEDIVWVVGLRLDERYRMTETTKRVLRVSLVRDAAPIDH